MTRIIHIWNHPWKFVVRQVEREFFGTIGFISSVAILSYGVLFRDSKLQTSSLSATGFNVFSIPVYVIGIILTLIFLMYLYWRRK